MVLPTNAGREGTPPRCFCKRACKLLKTNDRTAKKSAKSPQECEGTGLAPKAGSESRSKRQRRREGEVEREEKSMESVGENIVVGACGSLWASLAGDPVSLRAGSLFASASLSSGD